MGRADAALRIGYMVGFFEGLPGLGRTGHSLDRRITRADTGQTVRIWWDRESGDVLFTLETEVKSASQAPQTGW